MKKTISIAEVMQIVRTGKTILKLDHYALDRVTIFNPTLFCKQYFAAEFGDEIIEVPYTDYCERRRTRSINASAIERALRLCAGVGKVHLWLEGEKAIRIGQVIE